VSRCAVDGDSVSAVSGAVCGVNVCVDLSAVAGAGAGGGEYIGFCCACWLVDGRVASEGVEVEVEVAEVAM